MSLIGLAPEAAPPVEPAIPNVQSPAAKSTIVDTSITPRNTLIAYAEGAPWLTHYYQLILSKDAGLYGHDASQSAVNQTYRKILRLEMRLQGELNITQDTQDKRFSGRGTALIPQGVIANSGDMFAADLGDGREGIFEVSNSTRKTMRDQAIYEIEFRLIFIARDDQPRYADLENKVADTVVFMRDYARLGKDPIVATEVFYDIQELYKQQAQITQDYRRWFFSNENACMTVPGQDSTTYDPFADKFLRSVIDTYRDPAFQRAVVHSLQDDNHYNDITLWDLLRERRYDLITGCRLKLGWFATSQLNRFPRFRSLYYSQIRVVVYPVPLEEGPDSRANGMDFILSDGPLNTPPNPGSQAQETPRTNKPKDVILEPLKEVHQGGFYVFSEAFYTGGQDGDLSLLEKLTLDFLNGKPVNTAHLRWLISNYRSWPPLHRYYYLPVCLMLMRSVVQEAI